jgi:hypothetical protein
VKISLWRFRLCILCGQYLCCIHVIVLSVRLANWGPLVPMQLPNGPKPESYHWHPSAVVENVGVLPVASPPQKHVYYVPIAHVKSCGCFPRGKHRGGMLDYENWSCWGGNSSDRGLASSCIVSVEPVAPVCEVWVSSVVCAGTEGVVPEGRVSKMADLEGGKFLCLFSLTCAFLVLMRRSVTVCTSV